MENSHLVELIKTLKPTEKQQILQFSTLSYFNPGKMKDRVAPFLELCFNHPWGVAPQNLEKKEIYAKIFPGQKFLEGKLEKLMVEAHRVVRAFLLTQYYFRENNEFHQAFDFSEIVRTRGLKTRYQQLLARIQKAQKEPLLKDVSYFHHQFLLEYAIHDEESRRNQVKGDLNIPNVLEALDIHYQLNRLALLNRFLLQQKVARLQVSDFMETLLTEDKIPERYLDASISIKINFAIFNLLKKDSPEASDIRGLFDLLLAHEKNLDEGSLREFYTYLRNLCILVLLTNFEKIEVEFTLHELYKDNLMRGYLHYEGKIPASRYWAVSSNATRVKDFEWALEFIEKYKLELIGENETQDIYRLNLANYLFGIGQFSECLDNIPPTSPFVDYLLHGKRLELKALYELYSDLLPYKLDAFKMFLSRTSQKLLSESQRQINSDFANLLHQLINSLPGDHKRSELLTKRIQEKKQSAEWRWLLEKAKALNPN